MKLLKVVLADDNVLTLNQISGLISSRDMGVVVVGQAMDGHTAAQLLQSARPDLLIADVDMPGLNGVELSQFIADNHLKVKLLVLSNYDNFEYVRPIMKNGAVDYLLKHEITPEVLHAKLREVEFSLARTADEAAREEVFSLLAKQSFLSGLLLGIVDTNEYEVMLRQAEFSGDMWGLLLLHIFPPQGHGSTQVAAEKARLARSVLSLLSSACGTLENGIVCPTEETEEFAVLFRFESGAPHARAEEKMAEYAALLEGNMQRLLQVKAMISHVVFEGEVTHIRPYYLRAKAQLPPAASYFGAQAELDLRMEKRLIDALLSFDRGAVRSLVEEALPDKLPLNDIKRMAQALLRVGERFLLTYRAPQLQPETEYPGWLEKLEEMTTPEQFRPKITQALLNACDSIHTFQTSYSTHVQNTILYIRDNYKDGISLDEIARLNRISSAYLSQKFHQEVGVTFIEYLTNCRMEAVKRLLKDDRLSIRNACESAGFPNYNYFIQLFRERTGITPMQYKRGSVAPPPPVAP